jgi:hypothetical protein
MQQGRFRATGMMNHHPQALHQSSVAILVTHLVGHFWKADPGQFSKAPKDKKAVFYLLRQKQENCLLVSNTVSCEDVESIISSLCFSVRLLMQILHQQWWDHRRS